MSQLFYTPLTRLEGLQREFNRAFTERNSTTNNSTNTRATWSPKVDIEEFENKYLVLVDVPGVDDKDVNITIDKKILSIKGKRSNLPKPEKCSIKTQERPTGEFYRQFTLPDSIDGENISAKSTLGLLTITLPKTLEKKALSIAIN